MMVQITRDQMLAAAGQSFGCSKWFVMDQARIDAFAAVTEDHQFIHTDPVRAAGGMFGGTVAHGMLSVSMISAMALDALPQMVGQSAALNCGFENLRLISPVRSGARIRGHFALAKAKVRGRDKLMCHFDVRVEVEGERRAALTAQWVLLYSF